MGIIVKTNPSKIRPSQDFLKKDTLDFIRFNYEKGNFEKLPPTPIVRKDDAGNYIAIDGHNLLAFYSFKSMDCEVYVSEHKEDRFLGDSEMIEKRNKDLFDKYDSALKKSDLLSTKGIKTIGDLCKSGYNFV